MVKITESGTNWETYMDKVGLKVDPGGWLGRS